jgi:hypothetical protein
MDKRKGSRQRQTTVGVWRCAVITLCSLLRAAMRRGWWMIIYLWLPIRLTVTPYTHLSTP